VGSDCDFLGSWVNTQEPFFMPANNLSEWDAKHRSAANSGPSEPASFVRELLPLLPQGPALDLACGTGRHTLLLAVREQQVTAVDASSVALDILEKRARASNHAVKRVGSSAGIGVSPHGIALVRVDLEEAILPLNSFALILCVHYLQRSLFPQIERALAPGGMLLFETYTRAQLEFDGGPRNPEYLLGSGELRVAFPSLRLLFYRELRAGQGIASLIAQKPLGLKGQQP
jgi:tellurite methyltransferase